MTHNRMGVAAGREEACLLERVHLTVSELVCLLLSLVGTRDEASRRSERSGCVFFGSADPSTWPGSFPEAAKRRTSDSSQRL